MVVSLEMGWRHLLFANWPVAPSAVAERLPAALTVDTHDGDAWLSVVPFTNVDLRPRRLPPETGFELPELNLRTYVTCDGEPGVYFFSLDADGVLGVLGARVFQHLPYYVADIDYRAAGRRVRFTSERRHPGARPAAFTATYGPTGDRFRAESGSLASFLTDRYRLYTEDQRGRVRYADIDHGPWPLFETDADIERNTLFRANGFEPPAGDPLCYYSPGLDVTASRSRLW